MLKQEVSEANGEVHVKLSNPLDEIIQSVRNLTSKYFLSPNDKQSLIKLCDEAQQLNDAQKSRDYIDTIP